MKITRAVALTLLAAIFTVGLTFASIELPRALDAFLGKNVDTPDVATGLNELSDYKTEIFLRYFHLRAIGYSCLALLLVLIVVGFVKERSGWTSAGALILFLPVFGHFAATMFFLGGLGFLRLLWLPLLDVSFGLFRLGDIINLPHYLLVKLWLSAHLPSWLNPSYVLTGLGLLIFFLGTATWLSARIRKQDVVDFWIYRFSRHPQYLGWIIWSYGVMYLPGSNIKLCYGLSNSLPWLLSTMIILGVAMLEELRMRRIHGEAYESYRRRAPFIFPLPRFVVTLFQLPLRLMFKKEYPERKREIVAVLAVYTLLSIGTSAFYAGVTTRSEPKVQASGAEVERFIRILRDANDFAEKRRAAGELELMGEPAMEPLISLLNHGHPNVRAYAARALGGMTPERVVPSLIPLLQDTDPYVRKTAVGALGRTGSIDAIQPLVGVIHHQTQDIARAATLALGQIRHPEVIPYLLEALRDSSLKVTWAAAVALGDLGAKEAVGPIIRCFERMPDCPHDAVGTALWKLDSDRAVDVWIVGLKKGSWWYPRAFCATELGKKKLEKGLGPLQEALKDESKEVRRAVVLALMEFRSDKTIAALQGALADEDFEVRMYAQEALRHIGTEPPR